MTVLKFIQMAGAYVNLAKMSMRLSLAKYGCATNCRKQWKLEVVELRFPKKDFHKIG